MSILRGKKNSAAIESLVGVWEEQLECQGMSKKNRPPGEMETLLNHDFRDNSWWVGQLETNPHY